MHLIAYRTEIHATDNLSGYIIGWLFWKNEVIHTYTNHRLSNWNHKWNGRENEVLLLGIYL